MRIKQQPVVILGGFLSQKVNYSALKHAITNLSGNHVWVVDTRFFDWIPCISKFGWLIVLNKLDATIKNAYSKSNKKVIIIGHSQGGILARLYLSPEPFIGKRFAGNKIVDQLITLGSPHINYAGINRGGYMSRWIENKVPGSAFAPQVHYTSVAGRFIRGSSNGSLSERFAFRIYKEICQEGEVWGDGIVPVSSALLAGSQQLVLDDISHFSIIGQPWYGSDQAVPMWWNPG
jgi:pimeloyl-ACP methyl ester carboxylesterase